MVEILQPPGWPRPRGYSNGIAARGARQVFVAGQIGWTADERFETDTFAGQTRQALANVVAVLAEAGARPEHVVSMNWYLVDKRRFMAEGKDVGVAYRELFGRHYPAMTMVQVGALMHDEALLEIEATAVIPD